MIEINLIPQKMKKEKMMQVVVMAGTAGVVLLLAGMLVFVFYWQSKTGKVMSQIKKIDAESASLQDKIEEVKRFRAMEATYDKKKAIIDGLIKQQSLWPEIMDRIGEMILPDMWLLSMAQEKIKDEGIGLKMSGYALSKVVIADFLKRLETSPQIMDLTAANIGEAAVDNISVVSFEISFLYKTK